MVTVIRKRSASEIRREVRGIKAVSDKINKSPETARKFLRKNGFITKQNELSRTYR